MNSERCTMTGLASDFVDEIAQVRSRLRNGDSATQEELNSLCETWEKHRELLRPGEKAELFDLVNDQGAPTGLYTQRWLCHLLALRHRCTHVLLRWTGSALGNLFVLQVRAWDKADSPGHIDISVGGHVTRGTATDLARSAEIEMNEELGIGVRDLKDARLLPCGGYNSYDENPPNNFFNCEWREIYVADLLTDTFTSINFTDKEVTGLMLCPESEAFNLLDGKKNKHIAVASALHGSLDRCIQAMELAACRRIP